MELDWHCWVFYGFCVCLFVFAGAGGIGFTPHVIMVKAGEVCEFVKGVISFKCCLFVVSSVVMLLCLFAFSCCVYVVDYLVK